MHMKLKLYSQEKRKRFVFSIMISRVGRQTGRIERSYAEAVQITQRI